MTGRHTDDVSDELETGAVDSDLDLQEVGMMNTGTPAGMEFHWLRDSDPNRLVQASGSYQAANGDKIRFLAIRITTVPGQLEGPCSQHLRSLFEKAIKEAEAKDITYIRDMGINPPEKKPFVAFGCYNSTTKKYNYILVSMTQNLDQGVSENYGTQRILRWKDCESRPPVNRDGYVWYRLITSAAGWKASVRYGDNENARLGFRFSGPVAT